MFPSSSVGTVVGIGGAVGSVGSTVATTAIGLLWIDHSLLLFFGAGFAYLITLAAFQWKPGTPAPEADVKPAAVY
jgi:ACS family hexuronate transporter-like MFS transporter